LRAGYVVQRFFGRILHDGFHGEMLMVVTRVRLGR
jgi:hypothetical protein